MSEPLVSAIIPTFNRARQLCDAVATVLAQTYPAIEILVIDDGGTNDTEAVLAREFGGRVRYLRAPHGGASAARNVGMQHAAGEYIALLDDDDEWRPTKIALQAEVLTRQPEIGMVITDVERMNAERITYEVFSRRAQIPNDGWVLPQAMRSPFLVTSSVMFRREVLDATGGFNVALPTAEDLDFFLRVALQFQIAVLDKPLTRAMNGHDQLSNLSRTHLDYVGVIERFVRDNGHALDETDCQAALFWAYTKNARGLMWRGDFAGALRLIRMAVVRARTSSERRELALLGVDIAKTVGVRISRRMKAILGRDDRGN